MTEGCQKNLICVRRAARTQWEKFRHTFASGTAQIKSQDNFVNGNECNDLSSGRKRAEAHQVMKLPQKLGMFGSMSFWERPKDEQVLRI